MSSHVLLAVCDSAGSDPSIGVVEATVAAMLLPANVTPDASLELSVAAQLSALTAANVATLYLRTGSAAGPAVLSFTISAAGAVVQAAGTMPAPSAITALYLTGKITTGAGTASVAAATVVLKAIPPVIMPSLPRTGARAARSSDLGRDIDAVYDITPSFRLVEGLANLGRALARRLSTPRGALSYDPDYGLDLTSYLHADVTGPEVASLPAAVAGECQKDPRVQSANVGIEFDPRIHRMRLTVRGETAEGPFDLILDASAGGITVAAIGFRG